MNSRTNRNPGRLEQKRQELIRLGTQQVSDELKKAVDLAYKLSVREPPDVQVETLTSGSYSER